MTRQTRHNVMARLESTGMGRREVMQAGAAVAAAGVVTVLQGAEPAMAAGTTYRLGSRGSGVRKLQDRLDARGYWLDTPDGSFGPLTQQAIFAVQKAHGLQRDGVVGPNTRAAVAKNIVPKAKGSGTHVEIHLKSQLILIVRSGKTSVVLNTSTANGERYTFRGRRYTARTRPGDFAVWLQHKGWREGELGDMWSPMFYSGNYAIHGSRSIPPYPASHGCSRVSTAAMNMIWRNSVMSMGSRVLVV